jgi:hypothetical protein
VLGAHYDHLGRGEQGGSLYRGHDSLVHNGADDNASGSATLLGLARHYAQTHPSGPNGEPFNYLFLWFSGEEEGLLGSAYWVRNPTLPLDKIAYMVNMDMVGRVKDNHLGVFGTGTASVWPTAIDTMGGWGGLHCTTNRSGIGASDHTSFYLKQIPALFLFSGTHADYHKPTDDWRKLNYDGMAQVAQWVITLNTKMGTLPLPVFTPTDDAKKEDGPRFTVTLGIVPDYLYEGKGVKADGVSANKPAERAGLKAGDVIVQLGPAATPDLQAYMKALNQFKKGDKTTVKVQRGNKEMELPVTF